ncbi:MAG TPA: hypothetical protein VFB82_12045 [Blastocatellia bacterium]|nr:hypothetical protein [Blastocatellia bacterium]
MVEKLTRETFDENLNTQFRIMLDGAATLELELIEVKPGRSTPRQEQFSLLFQGPHEIQLHQGMFRLEHEKMRALDLFLVPVRKDEQAYYYEAVFNRLLE